MLTNEQTKNLKSQLFSQIKNSNLPEDQKSQLEKEIESMSPKELEEFVQKNNAAAQNSGECIFCSIAKGKIPSHKIDENDSAIAALEINPVSLGHTIIIPKIHTDSAPQSALDLAKKVSEKLKGLNPKKIDVVPSKMFGHEILNIIPVYKDENLNSERKKASNEELEKIKKMLEKVKTPEKAKEPPKEKTPEEPKVITEKDMILPKRIP